jgi:hypothetical protein
LSDLLCSNGSLRKYYLPVELGESLDMLSL